MPSEAYTVCVGNITIIGSDNDLSPGLRQAIIWTNAGILLIRPLWTNFSEILVKIHTFSFMKMPLKMSSWKCWPFCLGLNVLSSQPWDINVFNISLTWRISKIAGSMGHHEVPSWFKFSTVNTQKGIFRRSNLCPMLPFQIEFTVTCTVCYFSSFMCGIVLKKVRKFFSYFPYDLSILRLCRWVSARETYLQCISTGVTYFLH